MPPTQTVLFTATPRGVSVDPVSYPVSVFVSPRLVGAGTLGAFPEWLHWTKTLKATGLTLRMRFGARTGDVAIDTAPLRPDLWAALFNERTFVRSRAYDDYSQHGVISFSVRESLSALKAVYQSASVALALPEDDAAEGKGDQRRGPRDRLAALVDGFDVHWSDERAKRLRPIVRDMSASGSRSLHGPLDADGLVIAPPDAGAHRGVALPFAAFNNMPTPTSADAGDVEFDPKSVDFHQALGALESHPALLRALGLVFDIDVPPALLADTAPGAFDTMLVESVSMAWETPAASPPLATAYVNVQAGPRRFFFTAPHALTPGWTGPLALGLLNLDPEQFGLAQVDVDGGMHKAIMLAEAVTTPDPGRNLDAGARHERAPNPEVFDPDATLPALRAGGLQLYADRRGMRLLQSIQQSGAFNAAVEAAAAQPRPFFAEDLIRGYRLDVWDSRTSAWHSLHARTGDYRIGDAAAHFKPGPEEGFLQTAATQPAPGAKPADKDLYVHESIARWAGWSLSVPMPAKALSRHGDPAKAIPPDGDDPDYRTDEAVTAFKVRAKYTVVPGSLPRLRFGSRYRMRARVVDLAGNSLGPSDPLADTLAGAMALPREADGAAYLRFEPIPAPLVIIRDTRAVTLPGSAVDRLVIRTFNDDPTKDADPADLTASDRHVVPPRTSVEMGERLGMFDDAGGALKSDAATWSLISKRDAGEFDQASITIAGKTDNYPIETGARINTLPHLPDPLSRGAAIRDLPGSVEGAIARAGPGAGADAPLVYERLADPNPRPGSATIVGFEHGHDWQKTVGFRLALADPAPGQTDLTPRWDPAARVLSVFVSKGQTRVVPLTSAPSPADLDLLGVWRWLREYVDRLSIFEPQRAVLLTGLPSDRIAHVLQRAVEGGHWMLTPPRLLTLVHAVQQPIGRPRFTALNTEHMTLNWDPAPLHASPLRGRTDPEELAPIVAWRRPGATDAFLLGAILVHGASTAKLDLTAEWTDPVDDPTSPLPDTVSTRAHVDEIPIPRPREGYLIAPGADSRPVGYYDPENDQIAMVRMGDQTGAAARPLRFELTFGNAAPRHVFNDAKRHRVRYTAVSTSRYREYFPQDQDLDFTRRSDEILVDVPASARPLAPDVVCVVPTFGWQRQTQTSIKRSVRFGGGLRVYLRRPWFSSGEGELLGVTLWSSDNGPLDDAHRDKLKPFFTQWGMDPIWQTAGLVGVPTISSFPDAQERDASVSLDESSAAIAPGKPGRVDVVGFGVEFDPSRGLWFADLTVNLPTPTYSPFVRLALVRYQPQALADARISRVVLAGFCQLTPDRSATVTADPVHPRTLRVVVSGVSPRGPRPDVPIQPKPLRPNHIRVRVQRRGPVKSDVGWEDVPSAAASVAPFYEGPAIAQPDLGLWVGTVTFAAAPKPGELRLLIEELEMISATHAQPGRVIYAETIPIDESLVPH